MVEVGGRGLAVSVGVRSCAQPPGLEVWTPRALGGRGQRAGHRDPQGPQGRGTGLVVSVGMRTWAGCSCAGPAPGAPLPVEYQGGVGEAGKTGSARFSA